MPTGYGARGNPAAYTGRTRAHRSCALEDSIADDPPPTHTNTSHILPTMPKENHWSSRALLVIFIWRRSNFCWLKIQMNIFYLFCTATEKMYVNVCYPNYARGLTCSCTPMEKPPMLPEHKYTSGLHSSTYRKPWNGWLDSTTNTYSILE